MKTATAIGTGLLALFVAAAGAPGLEARTLRWRSVEVNATLDGDGLLHVSERQNMVFDGDWNGGERRFRLEPGQQLTLSGITRIDPETEAKTPLAEAGLSDVDHYAFTDSKTLRWRSRLPSDPPFSNREIDYVLDYTLSGVLEKKGGAYRLNHDFAFTDRDGAIEHFTLDLALDPSWKAEPPLPSHWDAGPLPPGRGFIVSASLQTTRPIAASGIRTVPILGDRRLATLLIALATLVFGLHYWLHDRARGRFKPLLPISVVDSAWLKSNVLDLRPEEVGTAIDDDVGAPEVAAVIARLVAEKKLASETTRGAGGKPGLRLTRVAPESAFEGYERDLVDGLFFGKTTVTPDDVRAHYKSSGFDPAKLIEKDLRARLAARGPFADKFKPPAPWRTLLLILAAIAFGLQIVKHTIPTDGRAIFLFLFASAFCALIGLLLAKRSAESFRPWNGFLVFGTAFVLIPWIIAGRALPADYSPALFAAFTVFTLASISSAFHLAMSRDGETRMEHRRRLATARRYFVGQLKSARPNLEDAWFPYLLALGLGSKVDAWAKSYAGASHSGSTSSFGGSTSSPPSSSGWTGGGGSFGGAGASAGWAAAVGGFAAAIAAPSSSSGGGGSSSGGGGGGGW